MLTEVVTAPSHMQEVGSPSRSYIEELFGQLTHVDKHTECRPYYSINQYYHTLLIFIHFQLKTGMSMEYCSSLDYGSKSKCTHSIVLH